MRYMLKPIFPRSPVEFLEDVGRSVCYQGTGQCVERHRSVRSPFFFP